MRAVQLSSTSYPMLFLMTLSVDHISPATGKTVTVTLSKNGGGFGAAAGSVSEIGNGWYALAGNATDRNTLGPLTLHATATGCDPADPTPWDILTVDPFAANLGIASVTLAADQAVNATKWAGGAIPAPAVTGVPTIDLTYILGTLLTESVAGYLTAAFKKFFNVPTPTSTMNEITLVDTTTNVTNDVGISQTAADKVWLSADRTLTSFGTLVADIWAGVTQGFFAKFFTQNSGKTYVDAVDGSVVKEIAANATTDPTSIAAAVMDYLKISVTTAGSWARYVSDTLASILTKANLIGSGVLFTSLPVGPDGRTQLVKGSTYKTAYGLALVYEFSGYPDLPVGGSCTWFARARNSSTPFSKTGTVLTTTRVRFELAYAESASLAGNQCSIEVVLAAGDPIRTPNMPLDLLDSVGA